MPERRERADAARNRERVLRAAERLFAAGDPRLVTMDAISREAGVGKGTLYRRFPDRAAVAAGLLDEHERHLQDAIVRGEPPLGPGAPPAERLAAFYEAMVDLLERHGHLALARETGALRFTTGAYAAWRLHVAALLAEAGADRVAPAVTDALLAPLAPELYVFQRRLGLSPEEIAAGLRVLARCAPASAAEA